MLKACHVCSCNSVMGKSQIKSRTKSQIVQQIHLDHCINFKSQIDFFLSSEIFYRQMSNQVTNLLRQCNVYVTFLVYDI